MPDALHRGRSGTCGSSCRHVAPAGPEGRAPRRLSGRACGRAGQPLADGGSTPRRHSASPNTPPSNARRARPRVELGAWTNSIAADRNPDVRRAAARSSEEHRSPAEPVDRSSRPIRNCSRTSRGSAMPCCAKTYMHEAAAIEPRRVAAAVPIGHAPESRAPSGHASRRRSVGGRLGASPREPGAAAARRPGERAGAVEHAGQHAAAQAGDRAVARRRQRRQDGPSAAAVADSSPRSVSPEPLTANCGSRSGNACGHAHA